MMLPPVTTIGSGSSGIGSFVRHPKKVALAKNSKASRKMFLFITDFFKIDNLILRKNVVQLPDYRKVRLQKYQLVKKRSRKMGESFWRLYKTPENNFEMACKWLIMRGDWNCVFLGGIGDFFVLGVFRFLKNVVFVLN